MASEMVSARSIESELGLITGSGNHTPKYSPLRRLMLVRRRSAVFTAILTKVGRGFRMPTRVDQLSQVSCSTSSVSATLPSML